MAKRYILTFKRSNKQADWNKYLIKTSEQNVSLPIDEFQATLYADQLNSDTLMAKTISNENITLIAGTIA